MDSISSNSAWHEEDAVGICGTLKDVNPLCNTQRHRRQNPFWTFKNDQVLSMQE